MNKKKAVGILLTVAGAGLLVCGIAIFASSMNEEGDRGDKGEVVKLGKRESAAPKEWIKEEPSNKLRKGQFRVPKAKGDEKDAEVALFHFPGGGTVEENLTRWKAKFKPPKGKKIDDISTVDNFKVNGVDVTYLDISGTYLSQTPPDPKTTPLADYRMIAVYFDSDDGPYFITLVGPEKTVGEAKKGFDGWLKAFK